MGMLPSNHPFCHDCSTLHATRNYLWLGFAHLLTSALGSPSIEFLDLADSMVNVNWEPLPSVDSTQISPPCAFTSSCGAGGWVVDTWMDVCVASVSSHHQHKEDGLQLPKDIKAEACDRSCLCVSQPMLLPGTGPGTCLYNVQPQPKPAILAADAHVNLQQ
jgi:hypothetical protein